MTERKKIPIGISEFSKLRNNDFYYIDKTMLVAELLNNFNEVTLITRPRRFGKTLNMTMIREFFSLDVDSKEIFSGLNIMETKYASEINKYPVLFFSFKDAKGGKRELSKLLKEEINREYVKYKFLISSLDSEETSLYIKIKQSLLSSLDDDLIDINTCIAFLCKIVFSR